MQESTLMHSCLQKILSPLSIFLQGRLKHWAINSSLLLSDKEAGAA